MSLRLPPAADSVRVNLYGDRFAPRQVPFSARFSLFFLGALLLVLAALAFYLQDANRQQAALLAAQNQRLAALQTQQDQLMARYGPTAQTALEEQLGALQHQAAERRFLLQLLSLHLESRSPAAVLVALGRGVVPGLWLTRMAGNPAGLILQGRAVHAASIPLYVERLHAEPALAGMALAGMTASSSTAATASTTSTPTPAALDFTITATTLSPVLP
ncbi:MAG: hypothetical protein ACYDCX_09180 [Acidithiobacillus sp.]